ncbi:TLC domain-containing protein 2-like isoform X2 [Lineus longissimus]|uniref:TLC domain-containing protein 2-like isoform X2 n=1 Tax=Lineus longissimus TaxID=88925 RepID=UPI00315CC089
MNEPVLMPASEPRIPNIDDTKNGILIVIFSFIFFFTIEKLLNFFIPKGASSHKTWQFKNILVSLVHSCISSIWAFSSFVESPEMAEDLISVYTQFSHSLVSFSVGSGKRRMRLFPPFLILHRPKATTTSVLIEELVDQRQNDHAHRITLRSKRDGGLLKKQ